MSRPLGLNGNFEAAGLPCKETCGRLANHGGISSMRLNSTVRRNESETQKSIVFKK